MTTPASDFDFLFEPEKVSQFLRMLKASGKKRVGKATIWSAFAETYRDLPQGPDRRRCLMRLLRDLEQCEELQLPVAHGMRWDRNSSIPIPTSIDIRLDQQQQSTAWREYPWHPKWGSSGVFVADPRYVFLGIAPKGPNISAPGKATRAVRALPPPWVRDPFVSGAL